MRPNLIIKDEKRKQIAQKFFQSEGVFVAEYKGIKVDELLKVRRELRKVGAEFQVVKNRIVKKAIEQDEHLFKKYNMLLEKLKGPVGIIYSKEDIAKTAKVILDFEKENSNWVIKGGVLEGQSLTKEQIDSVAKLPSKEVLIVQMLGTLKAPATNLVMVLSGVHRKLLCVLNAIKEKKASEGK